MGCGPLIGTPQDDDDDVGSASAPGTSETTDPTETTGQGCNTTADCAPGYYCDNGQCIYDECWDYGCCDFDGCCSQRGPDGQWEVRCQPPPECFDDVECWDGAFCTVDSYCNAVPVLPACNVSPAFIAVAEGTVPTAPSAVVAHPAVDDPGQRLLVSGAGTPVLEVLSPPTWSVDAPVATLEAGIALVGGDFDGDTLVDLVVATEVAGRVRMLRNDGFELAYPGLASEAPGYGVLERIAVGDLDADGDLDLAATNAGDVLALINGGDGSFALAAATYAEATDVAVADLDADGRAEIVTDGDDVTIWRFEAPSTLLSVGAGQDWAMTDQGRMAIGDVDADATPEIVVLRRVNGVTRIDLYDATIDSAQLQWTWGLQGEYDTVHVADVDNDGAADLVLSGADQTTYAIIPGIPGGLPTCAATYATGHLTTHLEVADLDNDTRLDIVTVDSTGTYRVDLGVP